MECVENIFLVWKICGKCVEGVENMWTPIYMFFEVWKIKSSISDGNIFQAAFSFFLNIFYFFEAKNIY